MKKNWLIRTTNNVILGPVSAKKLRFLIERGSLELNDEVCSGNGYWIFVKEKELLDKYLYRGVSQGFNPIYNESPEDEEEVEQGDELLEIEELTWEEGSAHGESQMLGEDESMDSVLETSEIKAEKEKKKKTGKSKEIKNGFLLKIALFLFLFLGMILLYFRQSILSGIFS